MAQELVSEWASPQFFEDIEKRREELRKVQAARRNVGNYAAIVRSRRRRKYLALGIGGFLLFVLLVDYLTKVFGWE